MAKAEFYCVWQTQRGRGAHDVHLAICEGLAGQSVCSSAVGRALHSRDIAACHAASRGICCAGLMQQACWAPRLGGCSSWFSCSAAYSVRLGQQRRLGTVPRFREGSQSMGHPPASTGNVLGCLRELCCRCQIGGLPRPHHSSHLCRCGIQGIGASQPILVSPCAATLLQGLLICRLAVCPLDCTWRCLRLSA